MCSYSESVRAFPLRFDFHTLPNEMWIQVFESMTRPSDLLKVIRTCKHFYALAIRVLYRNLKWLTPFDFTNNATFWETQNISMRDVPISLCIGISHMHYPRVGRYDAGSAIVEADGSWLVSSPVATLGGSLADLESVMNYITDSGPQSFFASTPLYEAVACRISSFTMLEELFLNQAILPFTIYAAIRKLPRLRRLSLQCCTLPPMHLGDELDFSDLPITELTLWCLKGEAHSHQDTNYVHALNLCAARHLRTLRVDWTSISARYFARPIGGNEFEPPPHLENLELRMPLAKLWPAEVDASRSMLINPLLKFLNKCSFLKRLTIVNRLPSLDLSKYALPLLEYYSGPLTTALQVLKNRPVQHLEITDDDKKLDEITHLLPELAQRRPTLETLCLAIRHWDNEILFPTAQLFPELRKLRIQYYDGFPSEVRLRSFLYHAGC